MENLNLIDWRMVGFAALWLGGLSVLLASVSMADYHAHTEGRRLRAVLGERGYQAAINLGFFLFCVGLLGSARTLWEQIAWGGLALAFAAQWALGLRRARE